MEFGKVDASILNTIDFSLPPDGKYTSQLPKLPEPAKLYAGGAKWGRKEWIGLIYPDGVKEKDFLSHYVRHFNGIELNATHYQSYPAATIQKWDDKVGDKEFKFCPKLAQSISHYGDLRSMKAQADTDKFLAGIMAFGKHLGPVFLQLSERYGPQRKEALYTYLRKWPKDVPLLLEVRHPSWFADAALRDELFGLLFELGIGTVITDVSGRRDCCHMEVTSPYLMIRFVGNGQHPTDYTRIDDWAHKISEWRHRTKEIHFYMHQPGELHTPQMTAYAVKKLNEVCGVNMEVPKLIERTGGLFD